ncbi:GrpB family protein [Lentibacillus jeotgali]|uniref:GrpB family protein n=1 Tax=Lentibacillus jeotgali TaxID=558169 RepID=UPI0002EBB85C|nr:GrpB family protein [Lentibacillus jeotgali]
MRKVDVVHYDAFWPILFDIEAGKLQRIFSDEIIDIHHIGSTSVEGLYAKPVIDMMPVVRDINRIDQFDLGMETIGYEAKGEFGITGRRFFQKGGNERTHHIHIFEAGNHHIERHLAFRDYLREHPDKAVSYSRLKLELAACFPDDIDAYIDGKNRFVLETERKALAWYQKRV